MLNLSRWILLFGILCFTGCQSLSTSHSQYPVSHASHLPAGAKITEKLMPGIWIASESADNSLKPKVIFDEVLQERSNKKMQVVRREPYTLTMKIKVSRATVPTEARMIYTLYRYEQGFWLTARAYQVTYPGSAQESLTDVTYQAGKAIQLELNHIAKKWKK